MKRTNSISILSKKLFHKRLKLSINCTIQLQSTHHRFIVSAATAKNNINIKIWNKKSIMAYENQHTRQCVSTPHANTNNDDKYSLFHTTNTMDLHANKNELYNNQINQNDNNNNNNDNNNNNKKNNICKECEKDHLHLRTHINWEIPQKYSWDQSTSFNYSTKYTPDQVLNMTIKEKQRLFHDFEFAKSVIDYKYHGYYTKERQMNVHNTIIDHYIKSVNPEQVTPELQKHPWIVFTAGPMGAGKTHTMRNLSQLGIFPLSSFIHISPDRIKRYLPEYLQYLNTDSESVGKMLRTEAGYICEVIFWEAIQLNMNIWNDTSMRTGDYFFNIFETLNQHYKNYKICLIYVVCDNDLIFERAKKRESETKRIVPTKDIQDSIDRVPKSVELLKDLCHLYVEIDSTKGPTLKQLQFNDVENGKCIEKLDNPDWFRFKKVWFGEDNNDTQNSNHSDGISSKL